MDKNILDSKKVYIFDVDGTLYSQPKMRIKMACRLMFYFGLHFWRFKDLLMIRNFRSLREKEEYRTASFDNQVEAAATKTGIDAQKGKEAIQKWMFSVPLDVIKKCAFTTLLNQIDKWKKEGKTIVIYSDYEADEKLNALGVEADVVYTPLTNGIDELKPSRKAMDFIMQNIPSAKDDVIYVGDRFEKDGKSAQMAGIDYCDIGELLCLLKK